MSEDLNLFQNALAALGIKKSTDDDTLSRSSSISSVSDLGKQRFSPASSPMIANEDSLVCRICECNIDLDIFRDHTQDCASSHEIAEKCHEIEHKLSKLEPLLGSLSRHASRESLASQTSLTSANSDVQKSTNSSPQLDSDLEHKISQESLLERKKANKHLSLGVLMSSGSLTMPNSPLMRPNSRKYTIEQYKRDLHVLVIKYKRLEWSDPEILTKCDRYFEKLQKIKIDLKLSTSDTVVDSVTEKAQFLFLEKRKCIEKWQVLLLSNFLDLHYLKQLQKQFHLKKSIVTSFFNVLLRTSKQRRSSHDFRKNSFQTVDISDFKLIKPISKGAYGSVFLSRKINTNDLFAIKIMKKDEMVSKNMVNHVLAERKVLSVLQSDFIVKMFFAFQSQNHLYLVMEYLNGGDLSSLLVNLNCFSLQMTLHYTSEIALALEYLHLQGIVHRDIKPDNILVDQQGHLKLTDFGLSSVDVQQLKRKKSVLLRKKPISIVGTPDYLAPELILGLSNDKSVDYWALGCCVAEFLTGFPPFYDESSEKILENIKTNKKDLGDIDSLCMDLINGLLTVDIKKRFTITDLKLHFLFQYLNKDWSLVRDMEPPFIPKVDLDDVAYFDGRNAIVGPVDFDTEALLKEDMIKDTVFEQFSFRNVKQLKELNQEYESSE